MSNRRDLIRVILLMIVTCVFAIAIVWISAWSSELQYDINTINSQIQQTEREVQNLQVQIKQASNINNLQTRAEEMGMVYPSFDQIAYLDSGEPAIVDFATALKQTVYQ